MQNAKDSEASQVKVVNQSTWKRLLHEQCPFPGPDGNTKSQKDLHPRSNRGARHGGLRHSKRKYVRSSPFEGPEPPRSRPRRSANDPRRRKSHLTNRSSARDTAGSSPVPCRRRGASQGFSPTPSKQRDPRSGPPGPPRLPDAPPAAAKIPAAGLPDCAHSGVPSHRPFRSAPSPLTPPIVHRVSEQCKRLFSIIILLTNSTIY